LKSVKHIHILLEVLNRFSFRFKKVLVKMSYMQTAI